MTTIDNLITQIQTATDYQKNKRFLIEKIQTDLHLPYNNGLFLITTELLAFLATWPQEDVFLTDVYENPVKVAREEFLNLARQHYHSVMNAWAIEHEKLRKIRKI